MTFEKLENMLKGYDCTIENIPMQYNDKTKKNFIEYCMKKGFSSIEDAGIYFYNVNKVIIEALEKADKIIDGDGSEGMIFVEYGTNPYTGEVTEEPDYSEEAKNFINEIFRTLIDD